MVNGNIKPIFGIFLFTKTLKGFQRLLQSFSKRQSKYLLLTAKN